MAETSELKIVIGADTKQAQSELKGFSGALANVAQIAGGIGLERIAEQAFGAIKGFVLDSVKAFGESESKITQLNAVLTSTKGVAGMTADSVIALSKSLQSTTTYSDEAVLSTENLLLTFTNIGKNTFPEATKAVLDMSTALGQDTKNSAIQLGKALQDPILGVTALRRVGVAFDDDQKNLIKTLVESGKTLEAQKLILAEINKEFGGSATAAATTYEGKIAQIKNSYDDLQEVIGKFIVNAIYPVVSALKPLIDTFTQLLEKTKSWSDIIDGFKTQFPALAPIINIFGMVFHSLSQTIGMAFTTINAIWEAHKTEVMTVMNELGPLVTIIWQIITASIQVSLETIKITVQVALAFIKLIWDIWGKDLLTILKGTIEVITNVLRLGFDFWTGLWKIFSAAFKGDWSGMWTAVKQTVSNIINDIRGILGGFFDWASGIINGLINGIKSIASAVSGKGSSSGKALGGYASGTTLVGENGPELVDLPMGSYVHTNQETRNMGGNNTVNIYNPVVRSDQDITSIVDQVKRALGRENELARYGLL